MAAVVRKLEKRTVTLPDEPMNDAGDAGAAGDAGFGGKVAEALAHFRDPEWLGRHSVLASPYLLGEAINTVRDDDPTGRGRALQRLLLSAADALPKVSGPYDPRPLLDATFFHPNTTRTNEGIAVKLALSPATYYRHRDQAVAQFGELLIRQLRPSLRFESPPMLRAQAFESHGALVGRELERIGCERALLAGHLAALTGASGMGKTTLAASIANNWTDASGDSSRPFWYTIRPGFNDPCKACSSRSATICHNGARRVCGGNWSRNPSALTRNSHSRSPTKTW